MADSSIRMSSSFACLYYVVKSTLSATATRRNKSSSLSELESVIKQNTSFLDEVRKEKWGFTSTETIKAY